ncbi:PIG-L deacetylase family protein [Heliophilum fasciatum]|uniref:LmbE family N-acetylglucosaminyl deacetylase n=1 Tax=Heliophilum fasciatum TaxID=35700 RepID=A0A4R2SAL4_9FIRM|nr:PIG-L deacetylase family protein [Heliophilum fasciatum]MCW2277108.1 LmbE family N-acetylglucosaminyl deacetylase [Heliophilum fasciatum]TCP68255.1 LmbE family N-acetylglucosaminyl deacetylase [Heliophilum fasciatum]
MNYLFVVAHPDDEVLGAGATIHKHAKEGHKVDVCIMNVKAEARAKRPADDILNSEMEMSNSVLGVHRIYQGPFPNMKMNTVPHLEMVQFIEQAILSSQPDVIITHHPADTNNDHLHTSMACQAALRLFQRRTDVKSVSEFWFMETSSSTDWSVNSAMNRFQPNTFIEVSLEGVEAKITALSAYRGVMRPYPHPRSEEAIKGLAAYRGSQSGLNYAEAFECVFRRHV